MLPSNLIMDLFDYKGGRAPLADRMRPRDLGEFLGQEHIVGPGKPLREAILGGHLPSLILWGPPGSGKTTLAYIIARMTGSHFIPFSAVTAGVKDIRKVVSEAENQLKYYNRRTILFIDEIHRFNKAQQDAFLPFVERGVIVLIGATTENPSFEVIAPLLSRVQLFVLERLKDEEVMTIVKRAISDKERGLGAHPMEYEEEALKFIVRVADGDARQALNFLELAFFAARREGLKRVNLELAKEASRKKVLLYDKEGEEHYNLISALHKSLRGSDPDASLYWLTRMLGAGEDPLYIARRLIRFASEDVGNADPQALPLAVAAKEAYHFLGSPEGELALAQCVLYLATCPKSNAVYKAFNEAIKDVEGERAEPVPLHLRNPVTETMERLGYGKGYKYPHDFPGHFTPQEYLPEGLKGRIYYQPSDQGHESIITERLKEWRKKRGLPNSP